MATHQQIYQDHSEIYEKMISRQPELADVVQAIRPFDGLSILDLGAGSGRLASVLAARAGTLICTDASRQMLDLLDRKLSLQGIPRNWTTVVADHRELPIADNSIDLAVAGWSICYLTNAGQKEWRAHLERILAELERVLKPGGTVIIFETMGTGTETPDPPAFLRDYYHALEADYGFAHRVLRLDYKFETVEEAASCTGLFFGPELTEKIRANRWATVPECAGVWWKSMA